MSEIMKPRACAVAFALPTSEADFVWSEEQPYSDYAKRFKAGGWAQYQASCEHLQRCIQGYLNIGVGLVHERLRLGDWGNLFQQYRVVILFAHSIKPDAPGNRQSVELWNCRASVDQLVNAIPAGFDGVIDLSACRPFDLAEAIERCRPNCSVYIVPHDVHPVIWAEIYSTIFRVLDRFELSYLEAVEKVVTEYRTQSKRRL
jgi:hypothetical protein